MSGEQAADGVRWEIRKTAGFKSQNALSPGKELD